MSDNSLIEHATTANSVATSPEPKKTRQTRHYQQDLADLQTRVSTAKILLATLKVEKGSQDTMNAVIGLLQG